MTKYVGARYMPKFMGLYDATTAYEALSVVDNGMGTSYVSNKPTPAGTPLTDTNYWVQYGTSSGAILNLQNQIDVLNSCNYLPVSSFTGADDTAKFQNAVDSAEFVYVDDDMSIGTIDITKPVVIFLGNHKLTSNTTSNNTFNIRCSNVEIFGGEIATTVDDVNNVDGFGSCIYINDRYTVTPQYENINIHDLKLSTNGLLAISILGEIYNSKFTNLSIDGTRIALSSSSAINLEWFGYAHTDTYHPHDILIENIFIKDYRVSGGGVGIRTAAAFNIDIKNVLMDNCVYAVALTSGDFGSEAAQSYYKEAVNRNLNVDNLVAHNCNVGVAVNGGSGYDNMDPQAYIKNVMVFDNYDNGEGVNLSQYAKHCVVEHLYGYNLNRGVICKGNNHTIKDCYIHKIKYVGIDCGGDDHAILNNRVYDVNQVETTGLNGAAILVTGGARAKIINNTVAGGSNEHATFTVRLAQDNSLVCENILYGSAPNNTSTGSVLDNNIVI